MKKTVTLTLKNNDQFFIALKEQIIAIDEIGWGFKTAPISSQVVSSTIKTLVSCLTTEGKQTDGVIDFSFEHDENTYPSFHNLLEDNINNALNSKIHPTALETLAEFVEEALVHYANLQEKNKNNPNLVRQENELTAITNYINATWDGLDQFDSSAFFKKVWDNVNGQLQHQISDYGFSNLQSYLMSLIKKPNIVINEKTNSTELGMKFMIAQSALAHTIQSNWNFEKTVDSIINYVKVEFPEANNIKPKGWDKFEENYIDYAGMHDLDRYSIGQLWTGMNSGTACSSSFEVCTALPYVMYDDKNQGRNPLMVLVGSIVSHAYVMNEKNNIEKMKTEWLEFKTEITKPSITEIDFIFKETLNKALYNIIINDLEVTPATLRMLGIDTNNKKKMKP